MNWMLQGTNDFILNSIKLNELIKKLDALGVFPSINHSRILSYLLASSKGRTAKEICSDLGVPNPKVYSALNSLLELGLIQASAGRPKEYLVTNSLVIEQFLDEFVLQDYRKKQMIVEEINDLIDHLWSPEFPPLDQVAYIYKGRDLNRQIKRMIASAQDRIFILLGIQSSTIKQAFKEGLSRASPELFLDVAIPEDFLDLENLIKGFSNFRKKISMWEGNSYMVIDGQLMLSITHPHDVGLLTNDPLLVDHIGNCWSNPRCCQ
ncbi:MAG: hypothetical protein D6732_18305 [Methanobacteriota archaeon]|nr:MAG: hypothetical protein D6732_18305 [Euryarchaeota archaeon]